MDHFHHTSTKGQSRVGPAYARRPFQDPEMCDAHLSSAAMRYDRGGRSLYSGAWHPHVELISILHRGPTIAVFGNHRFRRLAYDGASARVHACSPVLSFPSPVGRMVRLFLRQYPELRTPPLPATHVRIGNRLWMLAWWLPFLNHTHHVRPRVALNDMPSLISYDIVVGFRIALNQ